MEDKLIQKEKLNLRNKALFKGKDLELVSQVATYLEKRKLETKMGGGLLKSIEKGNLRTYRDIDLAIISGAPYEEFADLARKLTTLSIDSNLTKLLKKVGIYPNWTVKDKTSVYFTYMNLRVNYRFTIRNPKIGTEIDLTLGTVIE
jgi:hypothetical protein